MTKAKLYRILDIASWDGYYYNREIIIGRIIISRGVVRKSSRFPEYTVGDFEFVHEPQKGKCNRDKLLIEDGEKSIRCLTGIHYFIGLKLEEVR